MSAEGWASAGRIPAFTSCAKDKMTDERLRVDSDALLEDWCKARATFYAFPRTLTVRTPPKDKKPWLPLSIRTMRDKTETSEVAAPVAAR